MKIAAIYGSVREKRQGIKAARFIVNHLKNRGHEVTLIDPLEYRLPLLKKMYKSYKHGEAPEILEKLHKIMINSDAYVIVSGEYNHSIPPALSNILSHFLEEYFFKPSAIVSYSAGRFGGVRAAMQLRAMLAELGMPSIPSIFPIGKVQDSFDEQGNDITEKKDYEKRIEKFIKELEWYAEALKEKRKSGIPY
ncbi:NADPH-dependent FMN reductase [Candidatus Pacearchaeota archaeon]|nr:NADPH-dependent FMN reductase [Candidatus Pacearchaeota archaeon]MBD3283488.1 NADPH-dependent FMN reductase [Candidatus Pacearchaeota archaeon]